MNARRVVNVALSICDKKHVPSQGQFERWRGRECAIETYPHGFELARLFAMYLNHSLAMQMRMAIQMVNAYPLQHYHRFFCGNVLVLVDAPEDLVKLRALDRPAHLLEDLGQLLSSRAKQPESCQPCSSKTAN